MSSLIELIVKIFKAIFQVSMENPIEEKEEMKDVGETFDNPDDYFSASDW